MDKDRAQEGCSLQDLIRNLYSITAQLEDMYPGRHFTPDGHMVGSLGEVIASERYDIELYEASHPIHDAFTPDGKQVQIKTTQTNKVGIGEKPEYLIVLKLDQTGEFTEIYNGPGKNPWEAAGKLQKTGQRHISLSKLEDLSRRVTERVPRATSNRKAQAVR